MPVRVAATSEVVAKALDLVPPALTANATPARVELVFIESDVGNYQSLLNGLSPDVEVHILDASQDGLAQIAQALAGRSGIDAIHIVSHGAEGSLQLGASSLTAQNLASHAADLAAVGRALDANADILLYGCSVAAGSDGAAFVSALAAATQADIAASTNATGSAARGGDWVLESQQGDISTEVVFGLSATQAYDGLLASFNLETASGDNTKTVLQTVGSDTLVLTSTDDTMTLFGGGGVNNSSGLYVSAGFTVTETKVRIALQGGKLFDLTSFTLINDGLGLADSLVITDNNLVSQTYNAASFDVTGSYRVNTSFTEILYADITSTTPNFMWGFDNFDLNNITLPDTTAPTVTSVSSSTSNGTYKTGGLISVQVNFSESVFVTGTPQLTLETGTIDRAVNYPSGSGTSTLTFTYTVQAGDTSADLDYISTSALALNGGTIKDTAGNNATLTLATPATANSLGSNKALVVDGTAPAITSVSVPANSTYVAGSNLDFTVNFSEAVSVNTGGGTPYMSVTLDTGGVVQAAYRAGSGSSALQFRYTVASGNVDANGISIGSSITNNGGTVKDAAGNDSALTLNSVASTSGVLVEAVPPAFASAATNASGTKVILTYNDTLNATTAVAGNFTVMVGSSARTVSSAVVSGSTVELTLALAIGGGEVVTVAYADPTAGNDANAIQDALGNDAVSLSASTVTNNAAAQYYASFGQIFTANNPNGKNFSTFVAVNITDGLGIRVYPVDPSSPTYNPATNFVSNGSTNTVFLVVNGVVTQLYLTNGAEKLGGASTPEDAWVICNTTLLGAATTRYVLSSGGYSIDTTGESINSSINLSDPGLR
nr:DUF4347 domain-containing protein [Limnohabitans sp. 2KL-17]